MSVMPNFIISWLIIKNGSSAGKIFFENIFRIFIVDSFVFCMFIIE